jgi:transposase
MILGVKHTKVKAVSVDDEGIVADVAPTTGIARCSGCSCRVRKIKDRRERFWRHLDLAGVKFRLRYAIRRVACPRCGACVELTPWAEPGSPFTHDFEEQVAYLAQTTDKTTIVTTMRVAWRTVGAIVARVVDRYRPGDPLDGLAQIGVDELSFRKHHSYVTVVIDHDNERVVWVRPGKSADTLGEFFKDLGPERCQKLESVTMDMSPAYIAAVKEAVPEVKVIFDRFHVQRLAHDALDEVRRAEVRASQSVEEGRALKRTRFILHKNPWNLTNLENEKLTDVKRVNAPIYRAYLMKETLAEILDGRQVNVARTKL